MKTIEPILIWVNGTQDEGTILNAYCINDNLSNSGTFYYQILSENLDLTVGQQLTQGNLTMTGEVYQAWETNEYAYDWIAEQLNLTITGDYVPPVPTTTSTTTIAVPSHSTSTTTTTVVAE